MAPFPFSLPFPNVYSEKYSLSTMTTSSGSDGFCSRCGHPIDGHAAQRDSKCRKCKQAFVICQVGYHGEGGHAPEGWRICFLPCHCGAPPGRWQTRRDKGTACHGFKWTLGHHSPVRPTRPPSSRQARFLGSQHPQVFFTAADTAIHSLRGAWTDRQFEKITPRGSVEWRVEALNWVFGA